MKRVMRVSWLATLLSVTLALAHGGYTHVMGTVAAVEETRIVVKTREGKTLSVLVTKETEFRDGKSPASSSGDLHVGDRVVIELRGSGANATAKEIRFSSGPR